jgi:hypothetical protein
MEEIIMFFVEWRNRSKWIVIAAFRDWLAARMYELDRQLQCPEQQFRLAYRRVYARQSREARRHRA